MPAHVKSCLMGPSLTIPIQRGRLALGIWQVCAAASLVPTAARHALTSSLPLCMQWALPH